MSSSKTITSILLTFGVGALVGYLLYDFTLKRYREDVVSFTNNVLSFQKDQEATIRDKDSLLVVTRIHLNSAQAMPSIEKVVTFVKNSLRYASKVMICVRYFFIFSITFFI